MALTPEQVHAAANNLPAVDEIFQQYVRGFIRPVAARRLLARLPGLAGISQWEAATYLRWRQRNERER